MDLKIPFKTAKKKYPDLVSAIVKQLRKSSSKHKDKQPEDIKKLRYFSSSDEVVLAYEQEDHIKNKKGQIAGKVDLDLYTWINRG